jgi:hypothetical protein
MAEIIQFPASRADEMDEAAMADEKLIPSRLWPTIHDILGYCHTHGGSRPIVGPISMRSIEFEAAALMDRIKVGRLCVINGAAVFRVRSRFWEAIGVPAPRAERHG